MKFKTQFNSSYQGDPGSEQSSETQTVPDMGISLKQLLLNHSRGLPSNVAMREGHYFDSEIPQIDDLTDLQDARRNLELRQKRLEDSLPADLDSPDTNIPPKDESPSKEPEKAPEG